MPSRNIEKTLVPHSYYHVYNRGVEKRVIFKDDKDYTVFLNLLKRYLNKEPAKDLKNRKYIWLHDDIELLAYCLMPNHFHLFVYVHDSPESLTQLMQCICTAYTGYFNKKYKRVGHLFQSRYKASHILNDSYLQHISRYIHLNPKDYRKWQYSSLSYYIGNKRAAWINPERILDLFDGGPMEYIRFMRDYEDYKAMLDEIKSELAG